EQNRPPPRGNDNRGNRGRDAGNEGMRWIPFA
ncbi:hypothetical protein A2U01_0099391, partial [Trifolium medium]|nr:hypothetical protein [Trifolium medium]